MYSMPQMICVAGFVRQSEPMVAILLPGRACGMPYAPELALVALMSHMDSRMMMLSKQENCPEPYPYLFFRICLAIDLGDVVPGSYPSLAIRALRFFAAAIFFL